MSPPVDPLARRLRAVPTWAILAFAVGAIITPLLAILTLVTIADVTQPHSPLPPALHRAVVGLPTVLALYAAGCRFALPGPARWYLGARPDHRLLGWVAVGLVFPASVLGLQLVAFGAAVAGPPPSLGTSVEFAVASLAAGLLAGVVEELAFRGVLLRLVEVRWGPRTAVGITAAVFAGLHQGHAGGAVELVLVFTSMFAAGLLLGVVAVRTRSVWPAVALHAGWNTVFGGRIVTAIPADRAADAAVLPFRLPEGLGLLAGGGATLGAAPLTTASLLAATLAVARLSRHWPWPHPRSERG